jgi:hypothetical protein
MEIPRFGSVTRYLGRYDSGLPCFYILLADSDFHEINYIKDISRQVRSVFIASTQLNTLHNIVT